MKRATAAMSLRSTTGNCVVMEGVSRRHTEDALIRQMQCRLADRRAIDLELRMPLGLEALDQNQIARRDPA